MTRKEAISIMNVIIHMIEPQYDTDRIEYAVELAIKALEQEPCEDAIKYFNNIQNLSQTCGLPYSFVDEKIKEIIPALKNPSISEDGTLTVNVADGSKVSRVLVCGDNHFGGLYYPEQEPCDDCISRQYLVEKATSWKTHFTDSERCVSLTDIQNAPPVKPESKTGKWIWIRDTITNLYHCSCCRAVVHQEPKNKDNYCRWCGAKMQEVEE